MPSFLTPADFVECLLYEAGDKIPWLQAEEDAIGQWVATSGNREAIEWDWDGRSMILRIKEPDGSTTTVRGSDIAAANPNDWRFNRIRHAQKQAAA
jgi:hypothetical protein